MTDKELIQQITWNVFVETGMVACNLGLITTMEGLVLIDAPMRPPDALKWRDEVAKRGSVRYLINTEEHHDHCQGDFFLPGVIISHEKTREKLVNLSVAEFRERIRMTDPASLRLVEDYRFRLAEITMTESLSLNLGDLTFNLFDLPGHVPGGIGVHIPEERVVFTGDIVFHELKSWLHEADPEKWLDSLKKIEALDVDFVVPGHGSLCKKEYLRKQADIVRNWSDLVQSACERGLSEEEAQTELSCPDPYPIQPGVPMEESEVNRRTIANLYALSRERNSRRGS